MNTPPDDNRGVPPWVMPPFLKHKPPPKRRPRTPGRCTLGKLYYDEKVENFGTVSRTVPRLRLSGCWLRACGFEIGDVLTITAGRGVVLLSRRGGAE